MVSCCTNTDIVRLWAAAILCFLKFCWQDNVAIHDPSSPQALHDQVHLKTDQLGKGVATGRTNCPLCLAQAVLNFISSAGNSHNMLGQHCKLSINLLATCSIKYMEC